MRKNTNIKIVIVILSQLLCSINLYSQDFGKELVFDGIQDYAVVQDNNFIDINDEITIEAWIHPNRSDTTMILMKGWCAVPDYSYYLSLINGHIRWIFDDDGNCNSTSSYWTDYPVIDHGECAHIAVVHTENYVKIYKNGNLIPGSLIAGYYSNVKNSSEPLLIGTYKYLSGEYGSFYEGGIDELRIWNYERTQNEIMTNFNIQLNGDESGLVAYYDMEDPGIGNSIILINKALISGDVLDATVFGTSVSPYFTGSCATNTIDDPGYDNKIEVSPNPNSGNFLIKFDPRHKDINVQVINIIGEIIHNNEYYGDEININISSQPKGIYFVKVKAGNDVFTEKIVYQ